MVWYNFYLESKKIEFKQTLTIALPQFFCIKMNIKYRINSLKFHCPIR